MNRPRPRAVSAFVLVWRFFAALVIGGLQTVRIIVAPQRPPSALIRMRLAPVSPTGAALLGALITLTPGTTTLDIDLDRQELLLHVLDARDPQAVVAGIRNDFEAPIVDLFGTSSRTDSV
jgi:multisubunit Na+/H+ antiporter MnhE subunit